MDSGGKVRKNLKIFSGSGIIPVKYFDEMEAFAFDTKFKCGMHR